MPSFKSISQLFMLESAKQDFKGRSTLDNTSKGMRDFLILLFPLIFLLFSTYFIQFFERVWLSQVSSEAINVSVQTSYFLRVFQLPLLGICTIGQAYVGHYNGARQRDHIGTCIWQFIWFSCLSMLLIAPVAFLGGIFYLKNLGFGDEASLYFRITVLSTFFLLLSTSLSNFYLGIKNIKFQFWASISCLVLNGILSRTLILGIHPWIPSFGVQGAAIAFLVSQTLYCLILVSRFLSKTNQEMYGTHQWGLNWSVLWDYIKKGFPRGIGLLMINSSWLCSVYVISYRDKIALDVMSLSGSINLFVSFIGDALYRTLISLVSNALGAKDYSQVWKYIRKGVIALLVIGTLLAVPFIVFPDKLILLFHTKNLLDPWVEATLQSTFFWLWVQSLIYMFNNVWVSVIFAIKDTLFLLFVNIGSWLTIFLPIYVMSQFVEMMPSTFWALVCLGLSASSVMYISRVVYQLRQLTAHSPT